MSQPQAAARPRTSSPRYRRRRPEGTALYRVIQQHLETFVARVEASATAVHWPVFVLRELFAFLTCGILAHGFARVHCSSCGKDALVAFRVDALECPSCGARRKLIALITDPPVVRDILRCLGLDPHPPQRAPPRDPQHAFDPFTDVPA